MGDSKKELLRRIWSIPTYPGTLPQYEEMMGCPYEPIDISVFRKVEEGVVPRKVLDWSENLERLDEGLVKKVLDAGVEAFVHFSFFGGTYQGVPVKRKK